jgi:hypothetical protein
MSVLVGGILTLAASQLISPVKNANNQPARIRINAQLTAPAATDLHAFNPNIFTTAPDAVSRLPVNRAQNNKAPFIVYTGSDKNSPGEFESRFRTKSAIAPVSNSNHSANINVSAVNAGDKHSLDLRGNQSALQDFPERADVSAAIPEPEKSAARINHIHNDRFSWEIYVTPTLNTHHLTGVNYQNINNTIQSAPITVVRFANVNGFVDKTAALGYDLGGNILYRVSKNLSLKAGLQFSFSRYYFRAYNSNRPQSAAALSSYFGYIADSLANYSLARTVNPKNPQQYQNKYYQLSMPVGIEWKVVGKNRLQLHVGATVQPGYLLNQDAYVLSSDYSSYSKNPAVFRRWNLEAGAELFISYRVGKVRWELGPQLRYQILSTYKSNYPLQESLMNYGIRLGFSKTIR